MIAVKRGAILGGAHNEFRYVLWRAWSDLKPLIYIMLNPSSADADQDDPTIRVCCGRAKRWGYGGIVVMNLFAYRATSPEDMMRARDPIGPDNDAYLRRAAQVRDVIAAWGANGTHRGRDQVVRRFFDRPLYALRLTKDGHPCHPLRIPYDEPLVEMPRVV